MTHKHPGQQEPRSHGETHHENRRIKLNEANERELKELPMVGETRARALVENRPFESWAQVEQVPGFGKGLIDDLKSGGAEL